MDHFGSKPRSGNRPRPLSYLLEEVLSHLEEAQHHIQNSEECVRAAEQTVEEAIALSLQDEDEVADEVG
jgi:hypothetical protein